MKTALPTKYAYLEQARAAGIPVPTTLFFGEIGPFEADITAFLAQNPNCQYWILRSAVDAEDAAASSLAGHFWSSGPVDRADVLASAHQALQKNRDILADLQIPGSAGIMIQPYLQASFGGVLFSPWKYFSDYFSVEISKDGPQAVVSGRDAIPFLLEKDASAEDPLPLPPEFAIASAKLRETVRKLHQLFSFPLDAEWLVTPGGDFFLVQVRPVTARVEALLPARKLENGRIRQSLPAGDWQQTDLTENLGRLSPLSFSLIQALYGANVDILRQMGYLADTADFLIRLPGGQVFANHIRERSFFSFQSFFAPFWRNFRKREILREAEKFVADYTPDQAFSQQRLNSAFGYFLAVNDYCRDRQTAEFHPGEYELTCLTPAELPPVSNNMDNESLRNALRRLFFFELRKLKLLIQPTPLYSFLDWQEYVSGNIPAKTELKRREQAEVKDSYWDFSLSTNDTSKAVLLQVISGNRQAEGVALVIPKPALFRGEVPDGVVIVAPYFENRWIARLPFLAGVILENGGRFSHSAIIARENGVPYFIKAAGVVDQIAPGSVVRMFPDQRRYAVEQSS